MTRIERIVKIIDLLFPSPRAMLNFTMIWTFLSILTFHKENPTIVLVSAFAMLYFLNEWNKQIEQRLNI